MEQESSKPWPLWVLLLLAIVGLPFLGLVLVQELPHPLSSTGSTAGLLLYPFVAGLLILLGSTRARSGRPTKIFVSVAITITLLWLPILFLSMLAP